MISDIGLMSISKIGLVSMPNNARGSDANVTKFVTFVLLHCFTLTLVLDQY